MQQEHRSHNLSLIGFGMDDVEVAADYGTTNPLLWGLILDFSHRHHDDSRRSIDIAKEELIRVVTSLQTDDKVYVSEPGRLDIAPRAGVAVGQIAQYEMPINLDPAAAIRSTLSVIGVEDLDCRKFMTYITDRVGIKNDYMMELTMRQNDIKGYGCELILMTVGNKYDRSVSALPSRFIPVPHVYRIAETVSSIFHATS